MLLGSFALAVLQVGANIKVCVEEDGQLSLNEIMRAINIVAVMDIYGSRTFRERCRGIRQPEIDRLTAKLAAENKHTSMTGFSSDSMIGRMSLNCL